MTTICSGNKCEYADYCKMERIDGTTFKQAMDGVREYERGVSVDYPYCRVIARRKYQDVENERLLKTPFL